MGLFKRKRGDDELLDPAIDAAAESDAAADEPEEVRPPGRPQGPWDVADAPDDDGLQRLDLGGLRIPVPPQTEVRVEMSPERQVVAATLVRGPSAMQVSVFAAPRTEGIWHEVRQEISASLVEGGGTASAVDGPLGPELRASVPTEVPGGARRLMPARFLGVDGPRWFLRALLTGPAAVEEGADADLLEALRAIVVVRGGDPMAVRDPLPLSLPKAMTDAAAAAGAQQPADAAPPADAPAAPPAPLAAPERGPEITEIR